MWKLYPSISLQCFSLAMSLALAIPTSRDHISTTDPAALESTEVGWQSIFWSLFTLALLAMTQASILDSDFPQSSLLFPTRASPFVCVTDTLEVLLGLLYEIFRGAPISNAASIVFHRRLQHRIGDAARPEDIEQSAIKQHPKVSAILFLGSLTQVIKIFGFQGVFWPKVVAAIYSSSYLVLAGIHLLAESRPAEKYHKIASSGEESQRTDSKILYRTAFTLALASLAASTIFCSWAIYQVCDLGEGELELSEVWNLENRLLRVFLYSSLVAGLWIRMIIVLAGIFCGFVFVVMFPSMLPNGFYQSSPWFTKVLIWCLMLLIESAVCFPMYKLFHFLWERLMLIPWSTDGPGVLVVCGVLVWFGALNVVVVCERVDCMKHLTPKLEGAFWLVMSALTHLVVACLYYSFVYDSTGTVKPSWTENLG